MVKRQLNDPQSLRGSGISLDDTSDVCLLFPVQVAPSGTACYPLWSLVRLFFDSILDNID